MQRQLVEFRKSLTDATIELKANQNHNEQLLEHFSQRFSEHAVLRRVWKCLADNKFERQAAKLLDQRSDEIYRHNLKKKAFFPWRRYYSINSD